MRDTMDGTFSMSPSGGNAFSEFAREWSSRMGDRFALPPYNRATVSGFRARSRGFRLRGMVFNDFENAAALRTVGPRVGAEDHLRLWIVHRGGWRFGVPGGAEHSAPAGSFLVQAGKLSYFAALRRTSAQVLVLPAAEISRPRGTAAAGSADAAGVRLLTAHATMVTRLLDDLEPAGGTPPVRPWPSWPGPWCTAASTTSNPAWRRRSRRPLGTSPTGGSPTPPSRRRPWHGS